MVNISFRFFSLVDRKIDYAVIQSLWKFISKASGENVKSGKPCSLSNVFATVEFASLTVSFACKRHVSPPPHTHICVMWKNCQLPACVSYKFLLVIKAVLLKSCRHRINSNSRNKKLFLSSCNLRICYSSGLSKMTFAHNTGIYTRSIFHKILTLYASKTND